MIEQDFYNVLLSLGIIPRANILEVGCGEGRAAEYMYQSADMLILSDISEKAIEKVRERFSQIQNIRFDTGDITGMSGTFDLIYYFLSFHHIDKPIDHLSYIRSLLSHDGDLVICELYSPDDKKFHIHDKVFKDAYAPEDLFRLVSENGFKIKACKEVGVIEQNDSLFPVYILQAKLS